MRLRDIVIFALLASGCGSPTLTCVNGVDQLGRGPNILVTNQCSPAGSDLQCTSKIAQVGYCANTALIPGRTGWTSLEPEIATFTDPAVGVLKVLTPGFVEIYATYFLTNGGYEPAEHLAYMVGPGTDPERMVRLGIVVFANTVSSSAARVADAAVTVQPDRGPQQTSQTSKTGACEFWVLPGNIQISATKEGYAPAQITSVPDARDSLFLKSVTVALTPLS